MIVKPFDETEIAGRPEVRTVHLSHLLLHQCLLIKRKSGADDGSVLRCVGETGIEECRRFDNIASDDSRAVTNSVVMAILFERLSGNQAR